MNIRDQVTETIIAQLEKGAAPWVRPWSSVSTEDKNIISQEAYKGVNRLMLGVAGMSSGFTSNTWGTYKQWQSLGANVKRGEKGTAIVYYQPTVKKTDANGDETSYMLLKGYYVFNVDQVEGIAIDPPAIPDRSFETHDKAEQFIRNTGAVIEHAGGEAFYAPSQDRIRLPGKTDFHSEAHYYATAFHELTHWTGAKHRLDRTFGKRFGNPDYAFEELVAELGASFLCADHKIDGDLRHAGYIGHWLKALREDNGAIFKASALAQKAADYMHSLQTAEQLAA